MRPLRLYADTSVFGGCVDEEFAEDSRRLLHQAELGEVVLLVSAVVVRELKGAPQQVLEFVEQLPDSAVEEVPLSQEVLALRDAYLDSGILDARWSDDAAHVAAATVARADAIVSWNFRHIVRLDKMKAYNRINLLNGYGVLTITTPKEVRTNDDEG